MCNRGTLDSSFFLFPPNLSSSNWKFSQEHSDFVIFTCAFICFLVAFHKSILKKLPFIFPALLLDRLFVFFLVFFFFSFGKWLCKSNLKFSRHACNRMRSESVITGTIEPGYYRAIQNLSPSVFVACPSIPLVFFRFAFLIILCVYISSTVCAVLMLMISPNSLLPTEKKEKKNPFSQRHPDWHPQILMASKLISAVLSICYMKPNCGTHLPALKHGAG